MNTPSIFKKICELLELGEDEYFVLGDNREDSVDSREIGLIDKDDIIGKVKIRIWPINKIRVF